MGDTYDADDMPVLAARVSHADSGKTGDNSEADLKLMNFLAKHKHMTPFEHMSTTFKVVAPLFVVGEWHRHRTQSYNQVSMRYSDDPVGKFHYPEVWREQATRNKQSSAGKVDEQRVCDDILKEYYKNSLSAYQELLIMGVCREQARVVVPVGNYTEFYATANLRNWAAFCNLRCSDDAQWEIRVYANAINDLMLELWPRSWGVLQEHVISA